MAVTVTSGDLNQKVVFKQPVSSLNDRGETEKTFTDEVTTWAFVERFNQFRTVEANDTTLIGSLDFFIRLSSLTAGIKKSWLITYQGQDYTIHLIDKYAVDGFIRFTAKVSTDG